MKYRDIDGIFKELFVKTADTLPIGTIVEYDGDFIPAGWENVEGTNKIKKMEQSIGVVGNVVNKQIESKQDTYSCDYLNKKDDYINKLKSTITAYLPDESEYTTNERNSLVNANVVGNSLSLEENAIVIGEGVSKIKASAHFNVQTGAGTLPILLNMYIRKNGAAVMTSADYEYNVPEYYYTSASVAPFIIDVQEGDRISIGLLPNRAARIHNDSYAKSYVTVEVAEVTQNDEVSA